MVPTHQQTEQQFSHWSAEEDQYIQDNWKARSDLQRGEHLGRTEKSVHNRRCAMGLHRRKPTEYWSEQELEFLELHWGTWPSIKIAKKLSRSHIATVEKARSIELYDQMRQGDMLSLASATEMLGLKNTKVVRNWIENEGLRAKKEPLTNNLVRKDQMHYIIKTQDFLAWLEQHQDRWDSRKIPLYGLGIEYPWLREKREKDNRTRTPIKRPWTQEEKSYLAMQISRKIPYSSVAKSLNRSLRSVRSMGHMMRLFSGEQQKSA